jgi:hypothetical protein
MTCPACNSRVPEGSRFCPSCGSALSLSATPTVTNTPSPPQQSPVEQSPPKKSSPKPTHPSSSDSLDDARFVPGTTLIGRYRIVALLGRGGMGEVYRADDLKLGQTVALKFLPEGLSQDGAALARFHREVRLARLVSHPNVCRVFDIGEADGRTFLTMECVDGEDLASLLRRIGHLPSDKALEIARQLCAGLAAAHEHGVVHRDLKPANVMLDGRGRVRITDFGLAGIAGEEGGRAGTPAYMAPEQLAGDELTQKSDIYSLGLVLYEIFTGKRAFEGTTLAELVRRREQSAPTHPSHLVKDIDPLVERVILRCLEKDPAKRPASALQLAAALPGGDPLAAALAAGETPSPEMVAAAGDEGALRPRTAWLFLSGMILALWAIIVLARYGSVVGLAPIEKSREELQIRAKDIVRNFAYNSPLADSVSSFTLDSDYLKYRAVHEPSTKWYRDLAASEFGPIRFWYRQSPQLLIPANGDWTVKENDPPLEISGMVTVSLNREGRLLAFRAVPPQTDASTGPPPKPDWRPLFEEAGLDQTRFTPGAPKWVPPVPSDDRAEWDGSSAQDPSTPIHVAAATYRGRLVYIDIIGPWTRPIRMESSPASPGEIIAGSAAVLSFLALSTGGVIFARRNIRRGRGDRKGAFQLFVFASSITLSMWVLWGHFVLDLSSQHLMLQRALMEAIGYGAFVWVSYMALEPYVRRRWPTLLISWARLSSGKFRDPLVGRDLLVGTMVGSIVAGINFLEGALPYWTNIRGFTPFELFPNLYPNSLSDLRRFAGVFAHSLQGLIVSGLFLLGLLFLARILVRKKWLAIGIAGILSVALNLGSENIFVDLPITAVQSALTLFILVRFGLLAYVISGLPIRLTGLTPITLKMSYWYAGRSLFVLLIVLGLALYGLRTALAGRPVFGNLAIDD